MCKLLHSPAYSMTIISEFLLFCNISFLKKPITFKKQEKYLHIARTKLSWDN